MKFSNALLFTGLILFSANSYAQEEVIIIDKSQLKDYKKDKEIKLNDNTQVFKFAPLYMLVGEINFGYERQLNQKGSIEFELGPTISKIGFGVNSHFASPYEPSIVENGGIGFLASVAYRFYPLDETEALNRFYISPVLKYKLLNHTVEDMSNFLEDARGSDTQFNFYFNFGYQLWAAKSFSIDFYSGIGIGYQLKIDQSMNYEYVDDDWNYYWEKQEAKGTRYVFNAGIKLGIGKQ